MKREPAFFSIADFGKALLGSFIMGLTFLFKGSMVSFALNMRASNVIMVLFMTFAIVSLEIYILSYKFVSDRKKRPFYEFWAKRFFAITASSFIVIYLTMHVYGLDSFLTQYQILKVCIAIMMPAACVGAAIEVLKKDHF